jgi:hypothetical protein
MLFSIKIKQTYYRGANLYKELITQHCCLLCVEIPEIVVHPSKEETPREIPGKKSSVQPPSPSKSPTGHVDKYSHDVL